MSAKRAGKELNLPEGTNKFQSILSRNQQAALTIHFRDNKTPIGLWKYTGVRELIEKWYHAGQLPEWFKWEDKTKPIVSQRTLVDWKGTLWHRSEKLDQNLEMQVPVDWQDREKIARLSNVPLEGTMRSDLFQWWKALQLVAKSNNQEPVQPTYRVLKWWAYMYDYYPDLEIRDAIWIAEQFFWREAESIMLSEEDEEREMEREDLDQWLLHEPWTSVEKYEAYLNMIESGDIKGLNTVHFAFDLTQMLHMMYGDPRDNMPPFVKTERHDKDWWDVEDNAYWVPQYLLPSQRFEETLADGRKSLHLAGEFADLWEKHMEKTRGITWKEIDPAVGEKHFDPAAPDIKPIVYRDSQD